MNIGETIGDPIVSVSVCSRFNDLWCSFLSRQSNPVSELKCIGTVHDPWFL
ncbi:hypothetical protein LCGC14_1792480 [marine sediment metagenome]|uniref:Uncharacterized protein n=1 Tax=marine sediment metagenome TaxID=412755 RepID=A0A0F9JRM6_9ZZZZ